MRMAAAFLLMEDNGSWPAVQTELALDLINRRLEYIDINPLSRGRVQAQGEKGLRRPRALADRMDFIEGGMKVVRHKAALLITPPP